MPTWIRRTGAVLLGVVVLLFIAVAFAWKGDLPLEQLKAKYATGASRFVDVDGMSVHVRDEGSGPPILLLHGTGSSLQTWDDWTRALSPTHRVVRIDLPGFGLTGPEPHSDYRLETYVAFLDDVAARLGLARFAIGGNSLGGELAWRFAAAHPNEVTELVLVDPGGFPRSGPRPLVFRLGRMPGISTLMGHLDPRPLVERTTRGVYGEPSRLKPDVLERYYEMSLRPGNRHAFGLRTAIPFEDQTAELRTLHMPTLILWGERDSLIPLADAARFAQSIPGSVLRTYPDLGHVPMEEDGARTAADVKAFLDRDRPAAAAEN